MRISEVQRLIEHDIQVQDKYEVMYNTMRYNRRKKLTEWVTEAQALADLLQLLSEKGLIKL